MAAKYEIEQFNGSKLSLWKLKIRAILKKDNFEEAIEGKPVNVIDERWKEMDDNVVSKSLHTIHIEDNFDELNFVKCYGVEDCEGDLGYSPYCMSSSHFTLEYS